MRPTPRARVEAVACELHRAYGNNLDTPTSLGLALGIVALESQERLTRAIEAVVAGRVKKNKSPRRQ